MSVVPFQEQLAVQSLSLRRRRMDTLQLNVGRLCNQACRHCHVDAGPWRTEILDAPTAARLIAWIAAHRPLTVDITGGAPELNPSFRALVEAARDAGSRVMDRCNLTILLEPGFEDLPDFLARHEVEIVASLPCYSSANVDQQRGAGVFDKSIAALRLLNAHGYGTRLPLHLVYNPLGPTLPGPQPELEADYKQALEHDFGIAFHRLVTLTNQPIARFAHELHRQGRWDEYLDLLARHFNPDTVDGLMCRNTLSVGHRGELFDCDFNQMLGMNIRNGKPLFLWDITPETLEGGCIQTGLHCYACTAGNGSSCTGALATAA